MRLKITHHTHYQHDYPVSYGLMELRLFPQANRLQKVLSWSVRLEGAEEEFRFNDQHGNEVMLALFQGLPHEIVITCEGEVETEDKAGVLGEHRGVAPLWYFRRQTALTKPGPLVRGLVRDLASLGETPLARMHGLSARIREAIAYETGATHAATTAEEAMKHGAGVCQDHSHVMISAARVAGLPARYVSGYLMMNDRIEQEAGHAWAEVYLDGLGWVGFDVSNAISPDARYVRVATGLDYRESAPVTGMHHANGDGAGNKMLVNIQVQQ